ncbi:ArsR/SmtB family transcription factor [Crossiella cryophila]|uniref:DNA-binding transcriptional ArsR family regulator n=1 Tax=Crossiella cryophila TaxID=43355 RepID=A0A7W7FUE6_9PSEU|nr:winged helix-turn-helix domain-containing protein [Crossiella cryophila]MBB4678157.1 DNA-binding transcriptional ArsR family regulator [Crossiella cryophila]
MTASFGTAISLAPLETLPVSVLHQPGSSLFSLLLDALGAAPEHVSAQLRAQVRSTLPAADLETLLPLRAHRLGIPDCLIPKAEADIRQSLAQVGEQDPEAVAEQAQFFLEEFHGHIPVAWQRLIDQPRPYVAAFARAFEAIWQAYTPVWQRIRPVLWRETERIGAAAVTGALPVALSVLGNHCWRVSGTRLECTTGTTADTERDGRRLVLIPLATGPKAASFSLEHPDRIELAYAVPGLTAILHGQDPPPADDPLSALLGPARARILRHCAHRPAMAEVATLLGVAPATATHHCQALEAAGLIDRQRQGRQVRLRQTARGEALVDLFS